MYRGIFDETSNVPSFLKLRTLSHSLRSGHSVDKKHCGLFEKDKIVLYTTLSINFKPGPSFTYFFLLTVDLKDKE